jgi:hypothetical protein
LPADDKQPAKSESTELKPKDDSKESSQQPTATYTEGEEEEKKKSEASAEDGEQSSPIASENQLGEEKESTDVKLTREPEVTEVEGLGMAESKAEGEKAGEEGATVLTELVPAAQEESVVIVSSEDSGTELTKILLEAFQRYNMV